MSFVKKNWLARIGIGLNRFRLNGGENITLDSNPVSVTQQGDPLSADNMNNLEQRIGNAFDEMAGNFAPIEVSPATTNHAVGTQLVYNGILYKVTSAISTGNNLVVGSNISAYPVSSALSDISDAIKTINGSIYVSDLDDAKITSTSQGMKVFRYSTSASNKPSSGGGIVIVFGYNTNFYTQIAFSNRSETPVGIFIRSHGVDGFFGGWTILPLS